MKKNTLDKTIKLAYAICPANRDNGLPTSHVAFLIRKNKIVKIGWNKNRTHPIVKKHPYHEGRVGIHAELDCLLKYDKEDLSDYEMVILRIDKKSRLNNSKPCPGCISLIKQFNLKNVYYSNSHGKIESYT
jgi:deoxycytidylate deaminase